MISAEREFLSYTEQYKEYGDKVMMKIDHSMRVKDLCADIADSIFLDEKDTELSAVCGLLHDIGRFEQWRRYRTYNDSKSVDHGELGAALLQEDNRIDLFYPTDRDIILNAVKYHNKDNLPHTMDKRNKMFSSIVRDSDKIDILFSLVEGDIVSHTNSSIISDSAYQSLLDEKPISNHDIKTKADETAFRLAFIFGLNFRRSFAILEENDYIDRIIEMQIADAKSHVLKMQLEALRVLLNERLKEKAAY